MNNNVKSATTAGLLGIFLGWVGAHDWYLGRKSKAIIHVAMFGAGVLLEILVPILTALLSYRALAVVGFLFLVLPSLGAMLMGASSIWGLVEGIIILAQGDAGLAQQGYLVATPQTYGQPYNNGQYNNGQYNGQNMGQNNWQNGMQNNGGQNGNFGGMQNGNPNGNQGNMNNGMNNGMNGGMNGQ